MLGQAISQPLKRQAAVIGEDITPNRSRLLAAQVITHGPQVGFLGLDGIDPAALLQPGQHLGDNQRRQAAEADLPAAADCCAGPPPVILIQGRVGFPGRPQPHLMRVAVLAVAMPALARAGGHRARPAGRQRPGLRVADELFGADAQRLPEIQVRPAQPGRR
jgi:hypothetical protein